MSKDNIQALVLPFHHVGPGVQLWVSALTVSVFTHYDILPVLPPPHFLIASWYTPVITESRRVCGAPASVDHGITKREQVFYQLQVMLNIVRAYLGYATKLPLESNSSEIMMRRPGCKWLVAGIYTMEIPYG